MLTVGSCVSGIGGIELGLERTGGFETKWQIENDEYASAVLGKHWPNAKRYGDIRSVDPARLEPVDVICGGYPCQPFSLAGARAGEKDERHLWPEMLRLIRGVGPRFVLLENVPGHLSMGFGRVLGDLAESGFDAEWDCIPASSVGAPHRRDRVFIVAYSERGRSEERWRAGIVGEEGERSRRISGAVSPSGELKAPEVLSDALGVGPGQGNKDSRRAPKRTGAPRQWRRSADSDWWATEPGIRRVAHGIPSRVDRLKCLGNAVVPQVAQRVGEMILKALVA